MTQLFSLNSYAIHCSRVVAQEEFYFHQKKMVAVFYVLAANGFLWSQLFFYCSLQPVEHALKVLNTLYKYFRG